ncbi:MAG TPA: hypothetical protein VLA88_02715 [Candidatus Saccharimonadales bacterium]|nr:hypothetical protein [Candidatus Saccharimonadales bacterium]
MSIVHSGTFNESRAELPDVSKGPHKGALPTMTYHASTQPVDIFPDVFGLSGRWSGTFLVACSVAPVAGITFHDDRPQAERTAHPLSA